MCPSCFSHDISRSKKRKLRDSFMRWMGKVAYRCRDCHRRFYINIDVDLRLRKAEEWKKRSEEHAAAAREQKKRTEGELQQAPILKSDV